MSTISIAHVVTRRRVNAGLVVIVVAAIAAATLSPERLKPVITTVGIAVLTLIECGLIAAFLLTARSRGRRRDKLTVQRLVASEGDAVLRLASHLTRFKQCSDEVTASAQPLLAWLHAATDPADLSRRWSALFRQFHNEREIDRATYDPRRFIAEAETYYEFLRATKQGVRS